MSRPGPAWARSALRAARSARLATANERGRPSIVPVCFAYDGESIFTAIDAKPKSTRKLRRVRDLEVNPRAALLVDHYEEDWAQLWWVMARGPAALLEAGNETALELLRDKYPQYTKVAAGPEVIRLDVEELVAWRAAGRSPVS